MDEEPIFTNTMARAICMHAIRDDQCAKVLNTLAEGGGVTVDVVTGRLAFITAEQLASLNVSYIVAPEEEQ